VTATWNANTEPDIAGYLLSYGTQSGAYTTTIDVGNVTTYQLTLPAGTYYFAVQAYDSGGLISAYSTEVQVTTLSTAATALRTQVYVTGLDQPVAFVQSPINPAVQYVVQRTGRIRIIINGVLQGTDFLNVSDRISTAGEGGLLGLAFPPDHATSGRFYVNYTIPDNNTGSIDTVIARFKRSTGNPLVADAASEFRFLWPGGNRFILQPYTNHKGGTLGFGPDGYLYVGMGDGGNGGDPLGNAQNPNTVLGKMLRIDVSVPDGDPTGYTVPATNPFVGSGIASQRLVWAFGLRNPWKWSFDDPARGGTGALVIGDVGQAAYEEIDYEPAAHGGRNYGWRNKEGTHDYNQSAPPAYTPLVDPILDYFHDATLPVGGNSITGGYVYRGSALGLSYFGRYFFADYVYGRVWSLGLTINGTTGEATAAGVVEHTSELGGSGTLGNITSFGVDAAGELYLVSFSGTIFRIDATCPVTFNPASAAFDPASHATSVAMTTGGGCSWTAASNSGFLSVTGGTSGTGSGTVSYTVASNAGAANAATAPRQGTLTIADHLFTVSQAGCAFAISPTAGAFGSVGGIGQAGVTAPPGCPWTISALPPWAQTISGSSGTGNGTWSYTVNANGGAQRAQTVSAAGQSFLLTQLAVPVKSIVAGTRSRFTLAGAAAQNWSTIEAVAGRSYCAELAPAPDAQINALTTVSALRADALTPLASGARRACFIALANETVLFEATQTDSTARAHALNVTETTLWTNWFFLGGDYASYTLLRNTSNATVHATVTWRAETGVAAGTESITLAPGAVYFRNARDRTDASTVTGSIEIAHDGEPDALVASQTTLSATTGLSFDTLARPRRSQ